MAENDKKDSNQPQPDHVEVMDANHSLAQDGHNLILARHVYPIHLPLIPLVQRPFFPKMMVPMLIDDENLKKLLTEIVQSNAKFVGLVLTRESDPNKLPKPVLSKNIYTVGTIAEVLQVGPVSDDAPLQVLLGIQDRFRITHMISEQPHMIAEVRYLLEAEGEPTDELKAYSLAIIQSIKELVQLNPLHKEELSLFMTRSNLSEPGRLADFAAAMTTAAGRDLQEVLETLSIRRRVEKVLFLLKKETDIVKLQVQISKQIEEKMANHQRQFFLNEQLKAIKKELGLTKEGPQAEYERFEERIAKLTLTDEAKERIDEEMAKLKLIEPSSPEFTVTRNYLDWLTSLPWGVFTKDNGDIARARRILNQDHYGLEDVKERILEFLSVGILKGKMAGSILCFVGPPGVGKTSVGQSIARSIDRKFFRFSVGGARDEAEIKGHRRTYIGALPGKFIQAIKVCKSSNPVIMLDEVDKIGASYQGDPASALLEVLDPEQNRDFLDHYLDVRFDLSNVLFICTANLLDTIPRPLLDRTEVIKLSGYIHREKLQIAKKFIIPKQLKLHGLDSSHFKISDDALNEIIDGYGREPGVRGVENHIKKVMRRSVKQIVEGKKRSVSVHLKNLHDILGKRLYTDDTPFKNAGPGVVMGLAWTSLGGTVLYVEATRVAANNPGFKQTGQLGSVMVESSEIAYTFVRAFLDKDEQARKFFQKSFVHLHVPAGATPKDGPSAGITMACALYSLALNVPVKKDYAMTGELTLTGLVMPIGGVKEKTIAAQRAKVKHLVFPAENKSDFDELPAHIKKGIHPHFATTFEEVAKLCFDLPKRSGANKK